jgi:hypothetical protein
LLKLHKGEAMTEPTKPEAAPVSAKGEREAALKDLEKPREHLADYELLEEAFDRGYAAGRASLQSELDGALSLLEPASDWMSADEIDWWNRYARLRKEGKR